MTAVAKIDSIENLSCQERYGVIVHVERLVHVIGLDTETDYSIMMTALNHLDIPVFNDKLEGGEAPTCVLTERTVTVIDKDKADVKLVYEHYSNDGQNFDAPPGGVIVGEVKANIQQIAMNKDAGGAMIFVEHTYPDGTDAFKDDDGNTLPKDNSYPGETKKQTGEVNVFIPQKTLSYQGVKLTQSPWQVAAAVVGKVNDSTWLGTEARQWMCTACTWKLCDDAPAKNRYFFTLEFQQNPDTWDPTVVFIDDRTSRPPAHLVEGKGYKTIQWHEETNFDSALGTILQGG